MHMLLLYEYERTDGNLGFVATVAEMLLQTHVSNQIILLPALPTAFGDIGSVSGLRGRGDLQVAIAWQRRKISVSRILFRSNHPWLAGIVQTSKQGFFTWVSSASTATSASKLTTIPITINILAPNPLRLIRSGTNDSRDLIAGNSTSTATRHADRKRVAASQCASYTATPYPAAGDIAAQGVGHLSIRSFPCEVTLCGSHLSDEQCWKEARTL
jgi:hypothetical protein